MEAEASNSCSSSTRRITRSAAKKRHPLSDLTNLIPSTTLQLESPTPGLNSSKSDSSIGSSIVDNTGTNPSTNPSSHRASSAITGNGDGEGSHIVVGCSRKQTADKTKSKGEDVVASFSCSLQEKAKVNEKILSADSVALNNHLVEKTKDKGKSIASAIEKTKEKGKAIADKLVEKTQGEGNVTTVSINGLSSDRVKDKGKELNTTPGLHSLAKPKEKGKVVAVPVNLPPLETRKDEGKGVSYALSCPPLQRTINNGNEPNEAGDIGLPKFHTDPHLKNKKKKRCLPWDQDAPEYYSLPQDFIEQQRAYFKEIDEFELSEEEISDSEWVKEEGKSK